MNNIIIMGPQGVGKGTLCSMLSDRCRAYHLSTGSIFRTLPSPHPHYDSVQQSMNQHAYVSDEVTVDLVEQHLRTLPVSQYNSVLFDGFPRTQTQYDLFTRNHKVDGIVVLTASESNLKSRIEDRWIHEPSGRTYHTTLAPPKVSGLDDITSEPLTRRSDDESTDLVERLHRYYSTTFPIIDTIVDTPIMFIDTDHLTPDQLFQRVVDETNIPFQQ